MATSLSRMMKKAVLSSVIPLGNRNPYISAVFITPLNTNSTTVRSISTSNSTNLSRQVSRATSIPTHHPTSAKKKRSSSDNTLLRVIESEIDDAEEEAGDIEVAETPSEFPFKIVDNNGKETITLTRKYQDEEIKVTVKKLEHISSDYEDEDEDEDEEDQEEEEEDQDDQEADQDDEEEEEMDEESNSQYVELVVSVSKENQPTLEFDVTAEADGITINRLAVMDSDASDEDAAYQGPEFSDLNEDLQKALETYLEVRGIQPSIANFLHDYMVCKEQNECTLWLKKLRNFISN
ncbi:hypothetical protein MKW92_035832 [Papaver armeniacum]|nr:hypothetical protein MKW92_035832 [Papaver armeniacum]